MVDVRRVNAQENPQNIIQILEEDGCIIIENIIAEDDVKTLQNDLGQYLDQISDCQGDFYGYATKRMSSLFKKSKICQEMAILPNILAVMDHFLLKGCEQYQINLTQAISIGPGEDAQIIHQDDSKYPFMHPEYEVMINCMWAVSDFTKENGATNIVPGSHLWPRAKVIDETQMRLPEPHEITQANMKAGSVLIYLGSVYHSGGQNLTNKRRLGATISYCLGWLRQGENCYLAYTKDETKAMPEQLQKLLGYFVHAPNLGSVEGRDPIECLSGGPNGLFEEHMQEEAKAILKRYKERMAIAA